MTSFASFVLTDMLTIRANGLVRFIPALSVLAETRPKKSTTPTCPAGTTVKQESIAKAAAMAPTTRAQRATGYFRTLEVPFAENVSCGKGGSGSNQRKNEPHKFLHGLKSLFRLRLQN